MPMPKTSFSASLTMLFVFLLVSCAPSLSAHIWSLRHLLCFFSATSMSLPRCPLCLCLGLHDSRGVVVQSRLYSLSFSRFPALCLSPPSVGLCCTCFSSSLLHPCLFLPVSVSASVYTTRVALSDSHGPLAAFLSIAISHHFPQHGCETHLESRGHRQRQVRPGPHQ